MLVIFLLILKLKDLLTEFFDFLAQVSDLVLVLLSGLLAQIVSLQLLLLQLMDQGLLFLILLGCFLFKMVDLLLEESLLFIEF